VKRRAAAAAFTFGRGRAEGIAAVVCARENRAVG